MTTRAEMPHSELAPVGCLTITTAIPLVKPLSEAVLLALLSTTKPTKKRQAEMGGANGMNGHTSRNAALGTGAGGLFGHNNHHKARDAAIGGGLAGAAEHHHVNREREREAEMGTGAECGTGAGAGADAGTGAFHIEPTTGASIPNSAGAGTGTTATGAPVTPSMGSARSLRTSGKLDILVGTFVCSLTFRAKGERKEQQADAMRMQIAELSEVDRLEAEAKGQRGRVVAHGAHPAHSALGGPAALNTGMTAGTTMTSTATGTGMTSAPVSAAA